MRLWRKKISGRQMAPIYSSILVIAADRGSNALPLSAPARIPRLFLSQRRLYRRESAAY